MASRRPSGPSTNSSTSTRARAAPVGVTSSVFASVGYTGRPRMRLAVAGAGRGISPWAQVMLPPNQGSAQAVTRSTPSWSSAQQAPRMSTRVSTAPTSWKCTSSGAMPWASASARVRASSTARALWRTLSATGTAAKMAAMSAGCRRGWPSASQLTSTRQPGPPPRSSCQTSSRQATPACASRPGKGGQGHVPAHAVTAIKEKMLHLIMTPL